MTRSSAHSKELRGTTRPDKMVGAKGVPPLKRAPVAPKGLSTHAKAAWNEVSALAVRLGTLTAYDVPLLDLAARTLGSVAELEELLRKDGMVIESGSVRKAHPAMALLERSRAQAFRLLESLGLSPSARERISLAPPRKASRFAEFSNAGD
jgi:P27 family predicted phage terminase small subunit